MLFLAHGGGIDEMLFVVVPLLVFLVLQWLSRRRTPDGTDSTNDRSAEAIERRRRLSGGLIQPEHEPPAPPAGPDPSQTG